MNAYEIPGLRFSLPAGAEVERARFVSVNADGNGVHATADTHVIGASMNKTKAGEVLEVADGIVMVEASASIASGAAVYAGADGKAAATGTIIAGVAITSTTGAGQFLAVKI
jgi:hypothetical protein